MDPATFPWPDLPEVRISDAATRLSSVADDACAHALYLTRRGRPVAVIISPAVLARLVNDAEELADIRASDVGQAELSSGDAIAWEDAKRALGFAT